MNFFFFLNKEASFLQRYSYPLNRCQFHSDFMFPSLGLKGRFYVYTLKCTPLFSLNVIFVKTHWGEPLYSKLASHCGFYSRHQFTLSSSINRQEQVLHL